MQIKHAKRVFYRVVVVVVVVVVSERLRRCP